MVIQLRVATEFDVVRVQVPDEIQKRVDQLIAEHRCTACERKVEAGEKLRWHQCPTCWSGTYNAVKKKLTTMRKLVEQGKAAPGRRGPKPKNAYTEALRNGEL